MHSIVVKSRVGSDGVLHLELPLGVEEANKEVQVTVKPTVPTMTQEEWVAFVDSMAGCITDPTFVRHPQGELEVRDPFP